MLTKFVVWPNKIRYDINGILQQTCLGLLLSEMTQSSWVCLGLEQLGLRVLDDRPVVSEGGNAAEELIQAGTVMLRRALAQIGDLVHLQQLALEWAPVTKVDPQTTPVSKNFVFMDLSLTCGLNLLIGLKQLRKLQVSVRELAVGQQEVEWILSSWPKLTVIAGISRPSFLRTKATVAKDPPHILWLREHRQSLRII